jgi:hypothetical protein
MNTLVRPSKLEEALAVSLKISVTQILDYSKYQPKTGTEPDPTLTGTYTVIGTDFKKYTAVKPAFITEPTTIDQMPDHLYRIYINPKRQKRDDLRALATYLQIPGAQTMYKQPLVNAINQWKLDNAQTAVHDTAGPYPIAQAHDDLFHDEEE